MSGIVLILLTFASLLSGLWGLYRDLAMPLADGGLDCLCGIYMTTTCFFAIPPLIDSVLKLLFGGFLCLRTQTGWMASQRVLLMLMGLQGLMIPIGIGYQYRVINQAGYPTSMLVMPAIVLSMAQLVLIGLSWMILVYLRSSKIKRRFAGNGHSAPLPRSARPA